MTRLLHSRQFFAGLCTAIPELKDLHVVSLDILLQTKTDVFVTVLCEEHAEGKVLFDVDETGKRSIRQSQHVYHLTTGEGRVSSDEFLRDLGTNFPGLEELFIHSLRIGGRPTYTHVRIFDIANDRVPMMYLVMSMATPDGELTFAQTYRLIEESHAPRS